MITPRFTHPLWRTNNAMQLAARLDLSQSAAYKILGGRTGVGAKVIEAALASTPGATFADLFVIDHSDSNNERSATRATSDLPPAPAQHYVSTPDRLPTNISAMQRDPRWSFGEYPDNEDLTLQDLDKPDTLATAGWRYIDGAGQLVMTIDLTPTVDIGAPYDEDGPKDRDTVTYSPDVFTVRRIPGTRDRDYRPEVVEALCARFDLREDEVLAKKSGMFTLESAEHIIRNR